MDEAGDREGLPATEPDVATGQQHRTVTVARQRRTHVRSCASTHAETSERRYRY